MCSSCVCNIVSSFCSRSGCGSGLATGTDYGSSSGSNASGSDYGYGSGSGSMVVAFAIIGALALTMVVTSSKWPAPKFWLQQ